MKNTQLPRLIVIYIVVFVLVLLCSFYAFSSYITEIATETSGIRLRENTNNNSASIVTMFNKDVVFLESTAATISSLGKLDRDKIIETLAPLNRYTAFLRLAVDLPSGESYTSDGQTVNVNSMGYLDEVLSGSTVMMDIKYTLIEQSRCVAIVVPITQSGRIVGAVRGVYTDDTLLDMVNVNTFDGEGSFGLIDKSGNHISTGSHDTMLPSDNNIFISMQSLDFAEGYTLDKMRDDIMNMRSGYTIYRNGKNTIHSYYTPIGIGNWYAISSVTDKQMGTEKQNIENAAKLLLVVPILLFGLVLLLIALQNRLHHRKMEQEQEHLRNILDNIPLPLFITDIDKKLEFVNYAAQALFDREREHLIGKPCYIMGSSRCATPDCSIELLLRSKQPTSIVKLNDRTYQTTSAGLAGNIGYIQVLQDITQLMEIQNSLEKLASDLRVNEEMYRIALFQSKNILIDYNVRTKALVQNDPNAKLFDIPPVIEDACETVIGYGLIAPDYVENYRDMFRQLDMGAPTAGCVMMLRLPDGTNVWNRISFTSVFDSAGRPTRSIGIIENITAEQEERFKYERESNFRSITLQDAMLNYEIDLTHRQFITGHREFVESVAGKVIDDFDTVVKLMVEHLVYCDDREMVASYINIENFMKLYNEGSNKFSLEYRRNVPGSDKPKWTEGTFYMFEDHNYGMVYGYGTIRDISEQKQRELALKQKAERDLLTGLYNKITTETLISEHLASGGTGSLMIVDLDNFKTINDTFGHALGDAVLSETARHLNELFADGSIVGRIGGDEFAAFLPGCCDMEQIAKNAADACEMFRSAYTGLQNRKLSGTVGVAVSTMHGSSFEELYRKADIALYNAKALGKDTYSIYSEELTQIALQTTRDDTIDFNAGKVFSENITEYVLRILYESSDVNLTINGVLELLCKHYHFSRSYIFELSADEQHWINTYEWCDVGVSSQYDNLHQLAALSTFPELFDNDGVYQMCSLDEVKLPFNREGLMARDVKSMLHFAIYQRGKLCAHIGFDDCNSPRCIDAESISVLRYTTTLLGNFLVGHGNANYDGEMSTEEIEQVLDSIDNFIYVINKESHQLRYVNARTRNLIPETTGGGLCHKLLRGKDKPCQDCPVVMLDASGEGQVVSRIYNDLYDLWIDTTVSNIHWKGDVNCVLVNCNNVDE